MMGLHMVTEDLEVLQSRCVNPIEALSHQKITDVPLNLVGHTRPLEKLVMHANRKGDFIHRLLSFLTLFLHWLALSQTLSCCKFP